MQDLDDYRAQALAAQEAYKNESEKLGIDVPAEKFKEELDKLVQKMFQFRDKSIKSGK